MARSNNSVARAAKRTGRHLQGAAHRMEAAARHSAGDVFETLKKSGAEVKDAVREQMREQVEDLRERASDYLDQGRAKARELERTLEDRVRRRPLTAVLAAGGIGLAIGFFLRGR